MNKFYNLIALFIIVLFFNVFPKPSPLSTSNTNISTEIPTPALFVKGASEICMLAMHATSAISNHVGFYKEKMVDDCKIRVILLDPSSPSLETWNLLIDSDITKLHIETYLQVLKQLTSLPKAKGKCEVKLLNVFLPFSIFAIDLSKKTGSIIVEFHPYKRSIDDRLHVRLNTSENPHWFDYYKKHFNQAWADASDWNV